MKFKVGQKVRVREDLKVGEYYEGLEWLPHMEEVLAGKIVTLKKDFLCGNESFVDDKIGYYVSPSMLTPLKVKRGKPTRAARERVRRAMKGENE